VTEPSEIVEEIASRRAALPTGMALLAGLSGIDGCGKGYIAAKLIEALSARSLRASVIHADGWLNLPHVRFDPDRPAGNFYENAIRLDELFSQLLLPLRSKRSARVTMDLVEETATTSMPHTFDFKDLDVIVVEGVYLFKQAHRGCFDLAVWIDCSWQTALERAIARGQEGLSTEETIQAYRTIYFPAQEIHFARDNPRGTANMILPNDLHLNDRGPST
jgi:uridine kinase